MKFTVKAGRHYANNAHRMRAMWGNTLKFRFRIFESALYDHNKVVNNGWGKIFGVAEPFAHFNSCRAVYMCTKSGLRLGMYCYLEGISPQENDILKKDMAQILPGEDYYCTIVRAKDRYTMTVSGPGIFGEAKMVMPAGRWPFPFRLLLHPYIGGRYALDQDAAFEIEKLK